MKTYLEHLSKDEAKKKEFETAINNALIETAKKHGFDSIESEAKKYANDQVQLGDYTIVILYTAACCGQ
jgi:hypothetical protein